MTSPTHWQKKYFPDQPPLNAPDWLLSTSNLYMFRYSDIKKFREYVKDKQMKKVYMLMDAHIGKYPVPSSDFVAVTPFGFFPMSIGKEKIEGGYVWDGEGCAECLFSVFVCEKHFTK